MIEIMQASTRQQLDAVRSLMRAFVDWHRQCHAADLALIDQYFDARAFEEELAGLPGHYVPPKGRLLLAFLNQHPAGCVALRELDAHVCEMKRMFVPPQFQGKGVGRTLAQALIREAKTIGYSSMRLDTSFRQVEAQQLYQSLGFVCIEPYYEVPPELEQWLMFMEVHLDE
jgi:GNAT superfamily N-acetyltransferase